MRSLKHKLALSYGLLIVIILAVSAWSIFHLVVLGRAVDVILVNNYKSIIAAENMKEALERQDSAAMFFIAGHADQARSQFAANTARFRQEFQVAANNTTEPGEGPIVAEINAKYASYEQAIERFINPPQLVSLPEQSRTYFEQLDPAFRALKQTLDDLLQLNQRAMLAASEHAAAQSWRAVVSAAIAGLAAVVLALLFAYRFTSYVVDPISSLTEKAKRIAEGDFEQRIQISSQDEIGTLAAEFNRMATRLRELRQSEYWRLRIEQKKSDAAIDSIYEPVIVTDARGRVTKINRAARQLFDQNGNGGEVDLSLEGFTGGERILSAVQDAVKMQQPVAAEGEAALVPVKLGGAQRSFRLRTTPMRDEDGRLLGAVAVLEDITALQEVDKLKTEFISVASGKLREPLHSLQLALHSVLEGYSGELTEEQREMLLSARQDAEQLDEVMGDLLELAEIESGARRVAIERLRPIELVRVAIERFQSAAECKRVKLENNVWPDVSWVKADRQAVKRIFDNLLSNAIRHTGRDGTVTLAATERGDRVIFSVKDTGAGIPEAYLPNIFARFVQVEGRPGGGTGLGLALVKRLVDAQGGQIGVESRVGEGTTFTFTLPTAGSQSSPQ